MNDYTPQNIKMPTQTLGMDDVLQDNSVMLNPFGVDYPWWVDGYIRVNGTAPVSLGQEVKKKRRATSGVRGA